MSAYQSLRTHWRELAGVVISLGALIGVGLWASRQPAPSFPTDLGSVSLVLLAVLIYAVATILRGLRWHSVMKWAWIRHDAADAYALTAVGYMGNSVLPLRGGELLRIYLMTGRSSANYGQVTGSIIAERLLDVASLTILMAVMTWTGVGDHAVGDVPVILAVAAMAVAAVGIVIYLRLRRRGMMEGLAARIRSLALASRQLLHPRGLALLGLTISVWLLEGLVFYCVGQVLDIGIDPMEGLFLVVLTSFFALIPAAPAYVGTFDAAVVFGLEALGAPAGSALAFGILVRFILFVPITLVGLGLMITRYGGLRTIRDRAAGRSDPSDSAALD